VEYVCSDDDCRRRWVHDGGPLRHTPVVDVLCGNVERRWHPCPECEDTAFGVLAHRLRQRTADDLLAALPG
jgi:hypothetical protein